LGYLVCETCKGYYKLKKGESIDDFERCQCGGKFKYIKNLDELKSIRDNQANSDEKSICINCGTENLKNVKFCGSCGKPLNVDHINEKYPKKISGTNAPNQSDIIKKME
jgi:hypothetical protein